MESGSLLCPGLDWIWAWPFYFSMLIDPLIGYFVGIVAGLVLMIINIFFYFRDGQTIGYKILGFHIVDVETGKKAEGGPLIGRFFAKFLAAIPLYLGIFWIGWDPKKQGWHDKLAQTVVVKQKNISAGIIWGINIGFVFLYIMYMAVIFKPTMQAQMELYEKLGIPTDDYDHMYEFYDMER